MQVITDKTMIARSVEVLSSEIDEEVVLLNMSTGLYHGLEPTGSRIWNCLEQPHSFEELISTLLDEYEIDEKTCKEQTREFLMDLVEKKLINLT